MSYSKLLLGFLFSLAIVVGLLLMAGSDAPQSVRVQNWRLPTLGGMQFWADERLHGGLRMQRNALTGHYRLLDEHDTRRAWGDRRSVERAFDRMRQTPAYRVRSRHLVLLVHGIARGRRTFGALPARLRAGGFEARAVSYPSTRGSIEDHARQLERLLETMRDIDRVSFVTHSMGALVVRRLLSHGAGWRTRIRVGQVIMIAPPNQGSAIARMLKENSAYRFLYGEAGQQLVPEAVKSMPRLDVPFAIIAGGKGDGKGFNPVLPGDDDGTVSVAETRLGVIRTHARIPQIHGLIARDSRTHDVVLKYLLNPCEMHGKRAQQ